MIKRNILECMTLVGKAPSHYEGAKTYVSTGAVDCDHFLLAVLPLDPELNTAVWHEIYRREDQAGEGWKECVRCYKPFIPGSNRQRYCTSCGASAKQARIREKQRRYRQRQKAACSVTL